MAARASPATLFEFATIAAQRHADHRSSVVVNGRAGQLQGHPGRPQVSVQVLQAQDVRVTRGVGRVTDHVHADARELVDNLANGDAGKQAAIFARLVRRLAAAGARVDHGDLTALLYAQGIPKAEWVTA